MARHMSHAGRGLFVRYMSHRGRIGPARGQERGGLYHPSPASNMLPDNKFRMRKNEECPRMAAISWSTTPQAAIFPYSSLSSPSRAYMSRSETWNSRAVPPFAW